MIQPGDYDRCTCGHIRAEHLFTEDGSLSRCEERVRNDLPDQTAGAHRDRCACDSFCLLPKESA